MKFRNNFPPVAQYNPQHNHEEENPAQELPSNYYKPSNRWKICSWKSLFILAIILFVITTLIIYFYGIGRRKNSSSAHVGDEDSFEDSQFDLFLDGSSVTNKPVPPKHIEQPSAQQIVVDDAHSKPLLSSLSIQLVSSPFEILYFLIKDYSSFLLSTKQHPFLPKQTSQQKGFFDLVLFSNTPLEQLLQIPSTTSCSTLLQMQQQFFTNWKQMYEWIDNEREDFRELQQKLQESVDSNLKQWFLEPNPSQPNACAKKWLLWIKQLSFLANRITIVRPNWSFEDTITTKEIKLKELTTLQEISITVTEGSMKQILQQQIQFASPHDKPYMIIMEENFFISEDPFLRNTIAIHYSHYFQQLQTLIDPVHQLCVNTKQIEPIVSHLLKQLFWNGYTQFVSQNDTCQVQSILQQVNAVQKSLFNWNQEECNQVLQMFCQGKEQGKKQLEQIAQLASTMIQQMNPIHLAILKQTYQFPTVTCSTKNGLFGICHSYQDVISVVEEHQIEKEFIISALKEVKELLLSQQIVPHTVFVTRSQQVPSFVTPFLENQLLTVLHQSIKEVAKVDLKYFPQTSPLFYRDANMKWPTLKQWNNQTKMVVETIDVTSQKANLITVHLVKVFVKEKKITMQQMEQDHNLIHEFWNWSKQQLHTMLPEWKAEEEQYEDHQKGIDTIILGEDDEIAAQLQKEETKIENSEENLEEFHL